MREVSPLLVALVDDAAMFPPGNAAVAEAAAAHRDHRRSWFGPLVGPLVLRDQTLARQLSPGPTRTGRGSTASCPCWRRSTRWPPGRARTRRPRCSADEGAR